MPDSAALAPRSPRRVAGRRAGQREDLVARLRDLAGNYPAGIGILKEFLQNADDAGATWVRFTLDLRRHRADDIPDERMGALFGPALLVESDQTFTDADLDNIQLIGAAGKVDDAGKTGRFGLGFNTVYSITDYPSFATRDLIMTFDPFFDAVALKEQGEDPGINWPLDALWSEGADWPRAFGLAEGVTMLPTTTYRLPLRTVEQTGPTRIGRTAVSPDEVRSILLSLGEWGERLVLFLRSVLHVEARVVDDHGEGVLAQVSTVNVDEVRAARVTVLPQPGTSAEDILRALASDPESPVTVYKHAFVIAHDGGTRAATWLVCQGMFPGSEGEVLDAAHAMARVGEKAIPLGGAALPVQRVGDRLVPLPTTGTLCCTLPIPQPLSVGLVANARWSLASDRSRVRSESSGESKDAAYVRWNHALAEHVVPSAYAALFAVLKDSLDEDGAAAAYASWPDLARLASPFDLGLAAGIYRALAEIPSIRVRQGEEPDWLLPGEATRAPVGWEPPLVANIIADGLALAEPPVPPHVLHGLAEVDEPPAELTPRECREWLVKGGAYEGPLAEAPRRCQRDAAHVIELLRFCSERGAASLNGLPLAPMQGGSLRTFGHATAICLGDATVRSLFRERPHWFLHEAAEATAGIRVTQATNMLIMGAANVVKNLSTHLPKDQNGTWSPRAAAAPNEEWLTELYLWLATLPDLKAHLPALKQYGLVPDTEGNLVRPDTLDTPLLPTDSTTRPLDRALRAFGVPLVAGAPTLLTAIGAFADAAGGMVWDASPCDVVDTLARAQIPDVPPSSSHRRELLNWLAEGHSEKELTSEALTKLKALPLWPTKDGRVVAANADRVFLPRGFDPPPDFEAVTLLHPGPDERWRPFLEALEVPALELGEWIYRVFLPGYGQLAAPARLRALAWLRDKGIAALTQGSEDSIKKLREAVRERPLLQGGDGDLYSATRLYLPDARAAVEVLGPVARFPDIDGVYKAELDLWAPFFGRLGLLKQPQVPDVVARVEQLLRDLTPANGDETEAALVAVYDYLADRWENGEYDKSELARRLRELPWIPTMRRPAHDDDVALFRTPSERFMLPAAVYPARLVHQAASQVAFLARGKEDIAVRGALGMPSEVRPEIAFAHFRAVRDRWVAGGASELRPGAVGKAASAFYRMVGQLAGSQALADRGHLNTFKLALAGSACIWDPEARRFWRADRTFTQGATALAGLRVQVVAFAQEAAGLDALGRRPSPTPADYVTVLQELLADADGALSDAHLKVALRCWHELRETEALLTPDLPIPTASGTLVVVDRSLVDDAHYWRDRLASADLPWVHKQVPEPAALAAGARRVTDVVREDLTGWVAIPTADVKAYCLERSAHLASHEFALGVLRLVAHESPDADLPDLEDVRDAVALELVPCGSLSAGLISPDFGIDEAVGIEGVSCLLDEEERPPRVRVATDDPDSVALELGRALLRRLAEAGIEDVDAVDTAALETILRCSTERVSAILDKRKIRSLVRAPIEPVDLDVDPVEPEPDDTLPEEHVEEGETVTKARSAVGEGTTPHHSNGPSPAPGRGGHGGVGPHPSGTGGSPLPPIDAPPRDRQPLSARVPPSASGTGGGDAPRPPPTLPHLGQGGAGTRRGGQFYSYLETGNGTKDGTDANDATSGRLATEQAALECVDEFERGRGGSITPMAPSNEGYDREILFPGEAEPRIVEVKGLRGAWDARGVRLTPAELRAAHAFRERYWVYVVEFAKDPARRRLFRIRGPATQITAYCLDDGWMVLDEPDAKALVPALGLWLLDGDAVVGVIESVEPRGEAVRLTLKTDTGEVRRVNWNPSRHCLHTRST